MRIYFPIFGISDFGLFIEHAETCRGKKYENLIFDDNFIKTLYNWLILYIYPILYGLVQIFSKKGGGLSAPQIQPLTFLLICIQNKANDPHKSMILKDFI